MFSSVDLPQPDGPTSDTNVWPESSKLRPPSACTGARSLRVAGNTFVRFSMVRVATRSSSLPFDRRSCATVRLLGGALAPAERPPGDALQDQAVEQHDEDDE